MNEKVKEILNKVEELFKDDLILEVCERYVDLIKENKTNETNIKSLLEEYSELLVDYENSGHYTWLALAYLQHEVGRVNESVLSNALEIINQSIDSVSVNNNNILSKEELLEIKNVILAPAPVELKVKKTRIKPYKCQWNIGDVFAYQIKIEDFKPEGEISKKIDFILDDYHLLSKYIMFVKVGVIKNTCRYPSPVIFLFNWYGDKPIKNIEEIKSLEYLPIITFYKNYDYRLLLELETEEELNKMNLKYIGNVGELRYNIEELYYTGLSSDYKLTELVNVLLIDNLNNEKNKEMVMKQPNRFLEIPNDKKLFINKSEI